MYFLFNFKYFTARKIKLENLEVRIKGISGPLCTVSAHLAYQDRKIALNYLEQAKIAVSLAIVFLPFTYFSGLSPTFTKLD